jgi:ankyrin repeat protein
MSVDLDSKPAQFHRSNKKLKLKEPNSVSSSFLAAKHDYVNNSTSSFLSNLAASTQQYTTSSTSHFTRSVLLSKLTFNISRGHYSFVCELLKNKAETKQRINLDPDANEIITNQKLWLQLETNNLNKKFLHGKTPLILCCYVKETDWAMTISRLLIENGAYMSLKNATNGCGPLHYACALLKPDLVQLFLKNLSGNLQNTRDFNGNTPLIYLLTSFYFHYRRVNLVNNMSKSNKKKKLELTEASVDGLATIKESNEPTDLDVNFHQKIEQNNKFFQLKCVDALKTYLDQLRKAGMGVNTVNRLGHTLQDFYTNTVNHCAEIANHEFFKVLKNALVEESKTSNLKNSQFFKVICKDAFRIIKLIKDNIKT